MLRAQEEITLNNQAGANAVAVPEITITRDRLLSTDADGDWYEEKYTLGDLVVRQSALYRDDQRQSEDRCTAISSIARVHGVVLIRGMLVAARDDINQPTHFFVRSGCVGIITDLRHPYSRSRGVTKDVLAIHFEGKAKSWWVAFDDVVIYRIRGDSAD